MAHVRRWWWGHGVQLLTVTAAGALLTGAGLVISASYFPHFIVFGKGGGVTQSILFSFISPLLSTFTPRDSLRVSSSHSLAASAALSNECGTNIYVFENETKGTGGMFTVYCDVPSSSAARASYSRCPSSPASPRCRRPPPPTHSGRPVRFSSSSPPRSRTPLTRTAPLSRCAPSCFNSPRWGVVQALHRLTCDLNDERRPPRLQTVKQVNAKLVSNVLPLQVRT